MYESKNKIDGYTIVETMRSKQYVTTYKAIQNTTQQPVIIKIIEADHANQPAFIRHFNAHHRLLMQLNHPNIAPLLASWREPDSAYIIRRYFPQTLTDYIAQQPLASSAVLMLVEQIGDALSAAHHRQQIHGHLKPDNILLDAQGRYFVADFGYYSSDESFLDATGYRAPEQDSMAAATIRADVYSLGMILFYALTGQQPEPGQPLSDLSTHQPGIPAALHDVLQQATAAQADDRYADCAGLIAAVRSALQADGDTNGTRANVAAAKHIANTALDRFIKGSGGIRWRFEQQISNPYKGLRPFEEQDADTFYGRETLTQHLLDRLAEDSPAAHFLTVVGPSGSGKSSVIKAGVIAALRKGALPGSEDWFIIEMTPKSNPLNELYIALMGIATRHPMDTQQRLHDDVGSLADAVDALLPAGSSLVLVIDQFEELFTLTDNPEHVRHFLQLIQYTIEVSERIYILLTLRADFYDRPLMHPHFSQLVAQRTEAIYPMSLDELERAIIKPLEQVGVNIEPELVPIIIGEVKEQPGILPLLQFTLTELFDRSQGQSLTIEQYYQTGGVMGSLTRQADTIYEGLTDAQQAATRQLFLRLIALGEGTEDTRRLALQDELLSLHKTAMADVLSIFGEARLLTFNQDSVTHKPTVEVAHEAIIRQWGRLRFWLDESRDDLRQQRLLAAVTKEWLAAERDPSFLVSGARLEQIESWFKTTNLSLSEAETAFIHASVTERDLRISLEQQRQARERMLEKRARNWSNILAFVLAVSVILAFILTGYALSQQSEAIIARDVARETALLSNAQLSLYRDDATDLALALAMQAYQTGLLHDEEYRVLSEVMYAPGTRRLMKGQAGRILTSVVTQDGTHAFSGSDDDTIFMWDIATGEIVQQFNGHRDDVTALCLSPDGTLLASASLDGTLRLWDIESGEVVQELTGDDELLAVDFHPDGESIAASSKAATIQLWDVETGELLTTFPADDPDTETIEGHSNWVLQVVFSADGDYLMSGGRDDVVLRWDNQTEAVIQVYEHPEDVYTITLTADGTRFYSGTLTIGLHLWDVETAEELMLFEGHTAAIYDIELNEDETIVATSSQDGTVRLWDTLTGTQLHRFVGHSNYVYNVAFLPGYRQLLSSSADSTLRLWDIETDEFIRRFEGHEGTVYQAIFNADESRMLSAGRDATVRLWDVETGEIIRTYGADDPDTEKIEGHNTFVLSAAFSPDESLILSGDFNANLILWDAETGEILRVFPPDDPDTEAIEGHLLSSTANDIFAVWYVTFAPDGKTAFSTSFDKTIIRWNLETGDIIQIYEDGHTEGILGIRFLDGGSRFLSYSWDKAIILWDTETGDIIRRYEEHTNWIWSVEVSPDETQFISASADSTIKLWDIDAQRSRQTFLGHEDSVLSVDFSPDGQWIVSAGRDNRVTLWNRQTGNWVRHFRGHDAWVRSIDHSESGKRFVTAGNDGVILMWERRTLDEMVDSAYGQRYVRELTCEERDLFQVQPLCDG